MIIGLLGSNGQLGSEIVKVHSENEMPTTLRLFNRENLDFGELEYSESLRNCDYIINTVAYHKPVDELEIHFTDAVYWNSIFPKRLAQFCSQYDIGLVHISTDFVYGGAVNDTCSEYEDLNPKSAYGLTKLWGEQAVAHYLPRHYNLRVASLFGSKGTNFVENIIKAFEKNGEVTLPYNQCMSPTSCDTLAKIIFYLISEDDKFGTYNATNTGSGVSWYEFTKEIFKLKGLDVSKVKKKEYKDNPGYEIRPQFSQMSISKLLSNFSMLSIPTWEEGLEKYIKG